MLDERNHYQYLGLDSSASRDDIEAALARLSQEAEAVVYVSPQRARELWERIREMRADLLDPARRAAYDRLLVGAIEAQLVAAARASSPLYAPARHDGRRAGLLAGICGAVLALVAGFALAFHAPPAQHAATAVRHRQVHVGGLSAVKPAAGERIAVLHWSHVGGNTVYRVQIAVRKPGHEAQRAFDHPWITALVDRPAYRLRVTPGTHYLWRVKVLVDGRWLAYSPPASLHVPAVPAVPHSLLAARTIRHAPAASRAAAPHTAAGSSGAVSHTSHHHAAVHSKVQPVSVAALVQPVHHHTDTAVHITISVGETHEFHVHARRSRSAHRHAATIRAARRSSHAVQAHSAPHVSTGVRSSPAHARPSFPASSPRPSATPVPYHPPATSHRSPPAHHAPATPTSVPARRSAPSAPRHATVPPAAPRNPPTMAPTQAPASPPVVAVGSPASAAPSGASDPYVPNRSATAQPYHPVPPTAPPVRVVPPTPVPTRATPPTPAPARATPPVPAPTQAVYVPPPATSTPVPPSSSGSDSQGDEGNSGNHPDHPQHPDHPTHPPHPGHH